MKVLQEGTRAILILNNNTRRYSSIYHDTTILAVDWGTEKEQRYIVDNGGVMIHSPELGWHVLETIEIK